MADDSQRWWPGPNTTNPVEAGDRDRAPEDVRTQFERERDRILYSDEFERLRGVTQVLSPTEGVVCHDRLTHSLRVEQLALRMATNALLLRTKPADAPEATPDLWVTGAVALAHDLGHPPFGHVAEDELDKLLRGKPFRDSDGYEGNAQSFRILTRLACHREGGVGLRLSRRVLQGTLKYPWLSTGMPAALGEKRKYGAYMDDAAAFHFATGTTAPTNRAPRSIEAAVMDTADGITYSVHDLLDFYRAGLIDIGRIQSLEDETLLSLAKRQAHDAIALDAIQAFRELTGAFGPYTDSRPDRELVQTFTSYFVTMLISGHEYHWDAEEGWVLRPKQGTQAVMDLMQGFTRRYVIDSDKLAVTQVGHRRIVRRLFKTYVRAIWRNESRLFSAFFREQAKELGALINGALNRDQLEQLDETFELPNGSDAAQDMVRQCARLAADAVASLSDAQAQALHARLVGSRPVDGFLA